MRRLISQIVRWVLLLVLVVSSVAVTPPPVVQAAQFDTNALNSYFAVLRKQTNLSCTLRGTPSRVVGRIDLSWSCRNLSSGGSFLVEQSVNGKTWQAVSSCRQAVGSATSYSCSLNRLTSGRTYQFRLCVVTGSSNAQCGTANRTSAISVKAS